MASELIKLNDGTLIEIENSDNSVEQISGGVAESVESNMDVIMPLLQKAIAPIKNTFDELNKEMSIEKAEVELGLGFEVGGDLFIVKGKGKANLTVKLTLVAK